MTKLMIICGLMAGGFAAQAEECTPKWNVAREACNDGDQKGTQPANAKIIVKDHEKGVGTDAENFQTYCVNLQGPALELAKKWHVSPQDLKPSDGADNQDMREGFFDGRGTFHTFRQIACTYTANVPVFNKVVGLNCAITGTSDENGCFSGKPVAATEKTVQDCLNMSPDSEQSFWIKTECLVEAYRAAKESRMPVTRDEYKAIDGALYIMSKNAPSDHLTEYLKAEVGN